MNWRKVAAKFIKHGFITALGGAAAAIQTAPAGQSISWQTVGAAALTALITGGSLGAGGNYVKHRKR